VARNRQRNVSTCSIRIAFGMSGGIMTSALVPFGATVTIVLVDVRDHPTMIMATDIKRHQTFQNR
jgi:hypothetical protein